MSNAIVAVALIPALIAIYPFVTNIATVSELKAGYIPKWSNVPIEKRPDVYQKAIEINSTINYWIKILLELGGIFVVVLTVVEYYKFWKIYKEEEQR